MKLLVLEQWHLGDLALASPFLRAASKKCDVSLVAKAIAAHLGRHFWPDVKVFAFDAPWTAFDNKYDLWRWPWKTVGKLIRQLGSQKFDIAVSARSDPRDHLLMVLSGATRRIGFPRLGSQALLTQSIGAGEGLTHRFSRWQQLANALDFEIAQPPICITGEDRDLIIIHTGARCMTRVWPLERYAGLVQRLRTQEHNVKVLCDPPQLEFWLKRRESATVPGPLDELIALIKKAALFIGNDSGPGHIAAISGIPTFTIFGPQLPELFAPIHPQAEWIEGAPCPFKPCYDSCHFSAPHCLLELDEDTVWKSIERVVAKLLPTREMVHQNPV
jgi:ADP-heptose:LPS heptosyltransferase